MAEKHRKHSLKTPSVGMNIISFSQQRDILA